MTLEFSADPTQVLAIEELSLNAWPATHTLSYDGWLLRLTDGYTRRANSVQPLSASSLALADKVVHCEQIYTAYGLDTIFKVTSATNHRHLDTFLAARGYSQEAETRVQTLHLPETILPSTEELSFDAAITDRWLEAYARLSLVEPRHLPAMRRLLASIVPEHRFVAMSERTKVIAVGLLVLERSYAGIFDVVVDATRRRQGLGTRLVEQMLLWARSCGVGHAYLQVVANNVPALRLYANLGFHDAYTYWYRVKRATACATHVITANGATHVTISAV